MKYTHLNTDIELNLIHHLSSIFNTANSTTSIQIKISMVVQFMSSDAHLILLFHSVASEIAALKAVALDSTLNLHHQETIAVAIASQNALPNMIAHLLLKVKSDK